MASDGKAPSDPVDTGGNEATLPANLEIILDRLPDQDREIIVRQMIAGYSGPVPHAGEMERYRSIDPSFPERFMAMAEAQSKHRHALESKVLDCDFAVKRRGQDYAMVSTVLGLGSAIAFGVFGLPVVAGIVGGTTVVGIVTAFVAGRVIESRSGDPPTP